MLGLQITQIDHVSVLITDVERSRRFYCDLLGLKEIAKPRTFGFVALWFQLGDTQLHLLQKSQADTRSPRRLSKTVTSGSKPSSASSASWRARVVKCASTP